MLGVLIEKLGMAKAVTIATIASVTISSVKVKPSPDARSNLDVGTRPREAFRIFVSKTTMEFAYMSSLDAEKSHFSDLDLYHRVAPRQTINRQSVSFSGRTVISRLQNRDPSMAPSSPLR